MDVLAARCQTAQGIRDAVFRLACDNTLNYNERHEATGIHQRLEALTKKLTERHVETYLESRKP